MCDFGQILQNEANWAAGSDGPTDFGRFSGWRVRWIGDRVTQIAIFDELCARGSVRIGAGEAEGSWRICDSL